MLKEKKPIPHEFKGGRFLKAIEDNPNLKDQDEYLIMLFLGARCDLGENATFEDEKPYTKDFIAKKCRMSVENVYKKSKRLAEKGYIVVTLNENKTGKSEGNFYRMTSKVFDEYLACQNDKDVPQTPPPCPTDTLIHNSFYNYLGRDDSDHPYDPKKSSINRDNHNIERQIIIIGSTMIEGTQSKTEKQEIIKEVIGDISLDNDILLSAIKRFQSKGRALPKEQKEIKQELIADIDKFHLHKACRRNTTNKRNISRQP